MNYMPPLGGDLGQALTARILGLQDLEDLLI